MSRPSFIPILVLTACGGVIAYGFVRTLTTTNGMPIALIIAAPAIIVGRLAWRSLLLARAAPND